MEDLADELFSPHLHHLGGEAPVEPHPVTGGDHADAGHAAEDAHPDPPPVVAEVTGVDLSAEDSQDEGQDCQQIDLPPKLQKKKKKDQFYDLLSSHWRQKWLKSEQKNSRNEILNLSDTDCDRGSSH